MTTGIRLRLRQAVIASAATALVPCPTVLAADTAAGGRLYQEYCLACHGMDGAGLVAMPRDPGAFRTRLTTTENMPDMSGLLSEAEIMQVYDYLVEQLDGHD